MELQKIQANRQAGFTLVEIAIILIIGGVLIGGVLQGQLMMTNAKIRKIESDYTSISAAIWAYQDRYGHLPGDDPNASTRFDGTWTAADNGNGDGEIAGAWNSTNNANESRQIWKHLRGAGLIKGPVDSTNASYQQPKNSFGGRIGYEQNIYNLGGNAAVFGNVPGDIARILESRGDDGVTNAGDIQGHTSQTTYDTSNLYNLALND